MERRPAASPAAKKAGPAEREACEKKAEAGKQLELRVGRRLGQLTDLPWSLGDGEARWLGRAGP